MPEPPDDLNEPEATEEFYAAMEQDFRGVPLDLPTDEEVQAMARFHGMDDLPF